MTDWIHDADWARVACDRVFRGLIELLETKPVESVFDGTMFDEQKEEV